jgi:hypothetical protein
LFEKLKEKLQSLGVERKAFDPSVIGDPVAMKTGWTPIRMGGTRYRTHTLVEIDSNRMEFKASIRAKLFYLFFVLVGIAIPIISTFTKSSSGDTEPFLPILMGIILLAVGGFKLYFGTMPIVFDKYKRCFWKSWKVPNEITDKQRLKFFARLEDIHALQIVSEFCSGGRNRRSYTSYELNLVLKTGSRINVVDHGKVEKLREDVQTLSGFLGKPVWDAIPDR